MSPTIYDVGLECGHHFEVSMAQLRMPGDWVICSECERIRDIKGVSSLGWREPTEDEAEFARWEDIRRDPQAHIDALCEAGVLEKTLEDGATDLSHVAYRVVEPHVHEWRVANYYGRGGPESAEVDIQCVTCSEPRTVPNRLPIEAPE